MFEALLTIVSAVVPTFIRQSQFQRELRRRGIQFESLQYSAMWRVKMAHGYAGQGAEYIKLYEHRRTCYTNIVNLIIFYASNTSCN